MSEIPESWQLFMEWYPQMMRLQRKLATTDWYVHNQWVTFIGHYHAGIFMQLYKSHWFNYTLDGIHFEMALSAEGLSRRRTQIDLHIGHRNLFDRVQFNKLTVDPMAQVVDSWQTAFRFSRRNLSERLSIEVPFTKTRFTAQLTQGFARAVTLAPIIDEGLKQMQPP